MQGDVVIIFCQYLNCGVGGVGQLVIFIGFYFYVMYCGVQWNVVQWQSVICFDWCVFVGLDMIIGFQVMWCKNIVMFVIQVFDQGDMSGLVGVVFKVFDYIGDIVFILMKVDVMIFLFVIIVFMVGGDVVVVIMIVIFIFCFQQWFIRCIFVQIFINYFDYKVVVRGSWFSFNNCYDYLFFYFILCLGS